MRPGDIRKHWSEIAPHIREIFRGSDQRAEEVFAACFYGHASLYMADDGFCVLQPFTNHSTGETNVLVWVAYCDGGNAVDRYQGEIKELARKAGATKLRFESNRNGWTRVLPASWTRVSASYELEL